MADVTEIDTMKHYHGGFEKIDKEMCRYPHCIVWTPIPVLTYWKLDKNKVYGGGANAWDLAVHEASEEYKNRMHNLCCDNCHSHVAMALNLMRYDNSSSWNMVNLCLLSFIHSKHISFVGFLKTWLPFLMICGVIVTIALALNLR
ncbi:hypothetical protein cypCar_00030169 [Cyprinus carpio]|nr:hypothetical protein cypCar_00030169 [Cyprinus carpio]